jgi:phosphatidylserine decarboxylase
MQLRDTPSQRPVQSIPGIAPEGLPILGAAAALTAATALFSRRLASLPLALTLGASYFFRDPQRALPTDANFFYSATFLSLFDVHVNRSATEGSVRYVEHVPGGFAAAWGDDVHEANERNYVGLDTPHGPVMIVQIAGLVARRIVCHAQVGDKLRAGERFGIIKFGSRTDVLVPAGMAQPLVVAGMRVSAGITPVGVWNG